MKTYISLGILACLLSLGSAHDLPLVQSGMVASLSSEFFHSNREVFLNTLQKQMEQQEIEDKCDDSELGIVKLTLCLKNQRLTGFTAATAMSDFEINDDFIYNVYGVDLKYLFDFSLDSEPWWFYD